MSDNQKIQARTQGVSLFPIHQEIVDIATRQLGLQGNTFSATIQYILTDWARSSGIVSRNGVRNPQNYPTIFIGYMLLKDLASALDQTQPVYVAPHIETVQGTTQGQQTDHHYIMVTQPDDKNRVHYCRIAVVQLVYHNGIAFAPDYREQLAKVEAVRGEVEAWLAGEDFIVRRGMVALPEGFLWINGSFLN